MKPRWGTVKATRSYHSPSRADRAQQTRATIVDAARTLFIRDGFSATTILAIAAAAGISAETIYKAFGGKPGLVRVICQQALAGSGPVPAETRSDALHDATNDPRAIVQGWGVLTVEIAPRISPILLLLRDAAATEPEMAALQGEMEAQRLSRMRHNAQAIAAHLRPDLTTEDAAVILWTYSSPELYELLVIKQRWPLQRYGEFVSDALAAALLPSISRTPA
jgi:AcrR family transcriptional regulator